MVVRQVFWWPVLGGALAVILDQARRVVLISFCWDIRSKHTPPGSKMMAKN